MRIFFGLILLVLLCGQAHGAQPNRMALVEAVHSRLEGFVQYTISQESTKKLSGPDQDLLVKVRDQIRNSPVSLVLDPDRSLFFLEPGQPERLMRTTSEAQEPISINQAMLNDTAVDLSIALLAKLFVHEYSHKVGNEDLGRRDRLAQLVENALRANERWTEFGPHLAAHWLSLPVGLMETELTTVQTQESQRSFLLLLEQEGQFFDLTHLVESSMKGANESLTSMWAEANRAIFKFMQAAMPAFQQAIMQMMGVMKAFTGPNPSRDMNFEDFLNKSMQVGEIRVLELQDISQSPTVPEELDLTIKALYTVSRTHANTFPIRIEGWEWQDKFPVPVVLHLRWSAKEKKILSFDATLRPDIDYTQDVKVKALSREGEQWKSLKVQVALLQAPRSLELQLRLGSAQLSLAAESIREVSSGVYEALFQPPFFFPQISGPVVAEAVLIDHEKTHFLDRLVSLKESPSVPFIQSPDQVVVPGTMGLWGDIDGRQEFRRDFRREDPPFLLDHLNSTYFSLNPSNMVLEFETLREVKIRSIRLHFKRTLMVVEPKSAEQVNQVPIEGKIVRIATGGSLIASTDRHEIVSVSHDNIFQSLTKEGRPKTRVNFKMHFKKTRDLAPNEAIAPPMLLPLWVEIVTEDFSTITVPFPTGESKALSCESGLTGS